MTHSKIIYSSAITVTLIISSASMATSAQSSGQPSAVDVIDHSIATATPIDQVPPVASVISRTEDGIPQGEYQGYSIAELQDLRAAASQDDSTGSEIVAKADHEKNYIPIYRESEKYSHFAGGQIKDASETSWIGFKGNAPSSIKDLAAHEPIEIVENLPFSRSEIMAEYSRVQEQALKVSGFSGLWVDESDLSITVTTTGSVQDLQLAISTDADQRHTSARPPTNVEKVVSGGGRAEDHVRRGGGHTSNFTVGFILRSINSGAKRLATAGHCINPGTTSSYKNHPIDDSGWTAVGELIKRVGINGDLGYYGHGGQSTYPSFYWKRSQKRYVESSASSPAYYPPGKMLCFYGKNTGSDPAADYCAHVVTRTASFTDVDQGVYIQKITMMDQYVSQDGDSGGPWYWSETAYGVHYGRIGTANGPRSGFTPVHHFNWYGFEVWLH